MMGSIRQTVISINGNRIRPKLKNNDEIQMRQLFDLFPSICVSNYRHQHRSLVVYNAALLLLLLLLLLQ
jgi:hypothetical protein